MRVLIHPTYFPSIALWAAIVQADEVVFEVQDNYQKQTFRNRTEIAGPNGIQQLNVPVNFTQKNRQLSTEVLIDNSQKWQDNHHKSLLAAYSNSPFFEFYIDQLEHIFQKEFTYIVDLNMATFECVLNCLGAEVNWDKSSVFEKQSSLTDLRFLVESNQPRFDFPTYIQVFNQKHGFISNLSILDLIFNEGPNSLNYLESINLELIARP